MGTLGNIEKWLALVIVGVHAANSVPNVSSADRKAAVLDKVIAAGDAVAQASGDSKMQTVSTAIDVAAQIINVLRAKSTTAAPAGQ